VQADIKTSGTNAKGLRDKISICARAGILFPSMFHRIRISHG